MFLTCNVYKGAVYSVHKLNLIEALVLMQYTFHVLCVIFFSWQGKETYPELVLKLDLLKLRLTEVDRKLGS